MISAISVQFEAARTKSGNQAALGPLGSACYGWPACPDGTSVLPTTGVRAAARSLDAEVGGPV